MHAPAPDAVRYQLVRVAREELLDRLGILFVASRIVVGDDLDDRRLALGGLSRERRGEQNKDGQS